MPSNPQGNLPFHFPVYSSQPYASPYVYSNTHLPQPMPTYLNPNAQTAPNPAQMSNSAQTGTNLAQMGNNLAQMSLSQKKPPKPPKL
ncbi:MAG: hypothetical protein AAGM46_28310, partial [Cyanobacteria bacterium J06582_2]